MLCEIRLKQNNKSTRVTIQSWPYSTLKTSVLCHYCETAVGPKGKRVDYPLGKTHGLYELNGLTQAATTGASQPSALSFLRYALILRSLLNRL